MKYHNTDFRSYLDECRQLEKEGKYAEASDVLKSADEYLRDQYNKTSVRKSRKNHDK